MKLKLDENGQVVVENGMPVYVHDDGKEIPFDAVKATQKITQLNAEAKQHREAKEKAEADLKAFSGIDDPKAALEALKTVANLDAKKLIDAGDAEKVKAEIIKGYDEKLAVATAQAEKLQQQLHAELIGGSFARSKYAQEHLNIPSDVVQAFFGKHFSISDDGKVVAKFADGGEIFSRTRPGEKADFEEALEALVSAYPNKDAILKPSGSSGAGAGGGSRSSSMPKTLSDCKTDEERIAYLQANS
ncbi:DUF6651 domain-containing protein [Mannheimia haemolytica]|uniref:DUF6651 domain-containing protein n=1 Tax=Mannheimia haemolytica TaxID=75985 RepID=UPI002A798B04|nr:DUF6651 domain-containing protein [Mannheimia varigena]